MYIFSTLAITICLKATAKQPPPLSKIVSCRQVVQHLHLHLDPLIGAKNSHHFHCKQASIAFRGIRSHHLRHRKQPQVRQEDVQYLIQYRVLTTPPRGVGKERLSVCNPLSFCCYFTLEPVFSCIAGSSKSALLLTPS